MKFTLVLINDETSKWQQMSIIASEIIQLFVEQFV